MTQLVLTHGALFPPSTATEADISTILGTSRRLRLPRIPSRAPFTARLRSALRRACSVCRADGGRSVAAIRGTGGRQRCNAEEKSVLFGSSARCDVKLPLPTDPRAEGADVSHGDALFRAAVLPPIVHANPGHRPLQGCRVDPSTGLTLALGDAVGQNVDGRVETLGPGLVSGPLRFRKHDGTLGHEPFDTVWS